METLIETVQWLFDPEHWTGYNGIPKRTLEHIELSFWAMLLGLVIAIPAGTLTAHYGRFGRLVINIGNLGRAIPTFAVLIILASWDVIGISDLATIFALAIFAIPPLLVNTYVGVRDVDPLMTDAARGMGMSSKQTLFRVELPLAIPLIAAGVRTTTVQVVATASLAALVGGGGLGRYVVDGFALQDLPQMFSGVVLIAILSTVTDRLLALLQRRLTPEPLRDLGGDVPGSDEAGLAQDSIAAGTAADMGMAEAENRGRDS